MRDVARDIIDFNAHPRKDFNSKQAMAIFYKIMQKYGIKQGSYHKGNHCRTCNNPEWTMCLTLFRHIHQNTFTLTDIFGKNMPKDLEAYGKKPKVKM